MIPVIIGIAGGTGAGKTTLAKRIVFELNNDSVLLIHHDFYYKDLSHIKEGERERINFDHPESFDNKILIKHINELKQGKRVEIPQYDFLTHTRKKEVIIITSHLKIVLLEGIMILADDGIRECLDIKIFVDADSDVRILRRVERDMNERGRTFDSILLQYYKTVRPMHMEFVEPSKRWADIIIPNVVHNEAGISMLVRTIHSLISDRSL